MTPEIRGMLMGACIVMLAIAAWFLKETPTTNAPAGAGSTITAPERK